MQWFDDLCEYYNVDAMTAINLGTRSKGRKPNLPGSKTCQPVSDMTFEEIWDSKPRDTTEGKMQFYKDLGSWLCFRQCVYRKDFSVDKFIEHIDFNREKLNICEYGCGVSMFVNNMIEKVGGENIPDNITFHLVDVVGEHLEFAKWRLKKKAPNANFVFYEIDSENMVPKFKEKLDFIVILDVLEHVPNPYDVLKNIHENSNDGATLFETWIKVNEPGYSDLKESADERDMTMKFFEENFIKFASGGDIRGHKKK